MKKILALVLLVTMLFTTTALADDYSEHMTISLTSRSLSAAADYTTDALYQYITEKFNITMDPWVVENSAIDEKGRIFVNSDTMPDMMLIASLDYVTFANWVDQGLIAPLPDGWKETYPNLAKLVEKSGLEEYVTFDGQCYMIPHSIWTNFVDMYIATSHNCVTYRKDWAEQLGITIGETATVDELVNFAKKAQEAGLGGEGTIGFTGTQSHLTGDFMVMSGLSYEGFSVVDGQYVWNAAQPAVKEKIKLLRELYTSGVINPDFYLIEDSDAKSLFWVGKAAVFFQDGNAGSLGDTLREFAAAHEITREEAAEKIGITLMTDSEGVLHTAETSNYWQCTVFPPRMMDDTARYERVLSLMNWLADPTLDGGYLQINWGLKGVDWDVDANGDYIKLNEDSISQKYPSYNIFKWHSACGDEATLMNPNTTEWARNGATHNYELKDKGDVVRIDYAQNFYVSEAKSNYSLDVRSQVIALMVDTSLDVDAEWDNFVEANKGLWQPVVDDLNANVLAK